MRLHFGRWVEKRCEVGGASNAQGRGRCTDERLTHPVQSSSAVTSGCDVTRRCYYEFLVLEMDCLQVQDHH